MAAEGVKLSHAREQLTSRAQQALERQLQRMGHLASTVDALSPKRTLERGFAIARKSGQAVRDVEDLQVDDVLTLTFNKGEAEVAVTRVNSPSNE